jgi:hypothetical protein
MPIDYRQYSTTPCASGSASASASASDARVRSPWGPAVAAAGGLLAGVVPPLLPSSNRKSLRAFGLMQAYYAFA